MTATIQAGRPRFATTCGARSPGRRPGWPRRRSLNNAVQLLFTVIFTRLLGANGYGTLAALISAFLILLVAGQSVQMAAAREAALDRLGHPEAVRATLRAWTQRLLLALVVVTVLSALFGRRSPRRSGSARRRGAPRRSCRRACCGC